MVSASAADRRALLAALSTAAFSTAAFSTGTLALIARPVAAAEPSARAVALAALEKVPLSAKPLPPFPFLPMLAGYQPVPPELSTWRRQTDFALYNFQIADGESLVIGGRLMLAHFKAEAPGSGSLDKVVESHWLLVQELGGAQLYAGRFDAEPILKAQRTEQFTREGATWVVATPEREAWIQVSVLEDGDEYTLTVVEKGALVLKTEPLKANDLKRKLDQDGKAILYVNFDFDRATLKADAKPVLDEVYAVVKADPALRLSIEGHTDDRGPADYNRALSQRRAAAVVDALVARGLPAAQRSRLEAVGHGPAMPIADNKTDEGRARNRRVELIKRS